MQLGSATVLLFFGGLIAFVAAERQRFHYVRTGVTRKRCETQQVTGQSCEGDGCVETRPVTRCKTEVVYRTERHCGAGYERAGHSPDACVPVCPRGCRQGERCTAPRRCECVEGHERNAEGRCVAVTASLPGEEPTTLQAQILSYVSLLFDGVKSLGWQEGDHVSAHADSSAPPAHEENLPSRAAPGDYSAQVGATCEEAGEGLSVSRCAAGPRRSNATGEDDRLQSVWLPAGSLEQSWNASRLALAAPRLDTAQLH